MSIKETNVGMVISVLRVKGPRSSKELAKDTGLTISQVKYATHELKQSDRLGLNANGDWYEIISRFERLVTVRAWNSSIFSEVMA